MRVSLNGFMIRSFAYGFIIGFVLNIVSVIVVFPLFSAEKYYYNKEEQEIKTIGLLVGFLFSCIAIGWLVYCFKF